MAGNGCIYLGVFHSIPDLVLPAAFKSRKNVFFRDILYPGRAVVVWVVVEDDTQYPILCLPEPAFLQVVEDYFYPRLGACDVTCVCDSDGQRSPQHTGQLRCGMCKSILLIVVMLNVDEDAQIMRPRSHTHACPCELGAELVKTTS